MSLVYKETSNNVKMGMLKLTSGILEENREGQKYDLSLVDRLTLINQGNKGEFRMDENGVVGLGDRVCVPDIPKLKKGILEQGHLRNLSIHPGATKMYQDLKKMIWWPGMKKEIFNFVYACLTFQKSKIEYQKPTGLMQPLSILEWKWDSVLWISCWG